MKKGRVHCGDDKGFTVLERTRVFGIRALSVQDRYRHEYKGYYMGACFGYLRSVIFNIMFLSCCCNKLDIHTYQNTENINYLFFVFF
jgi:hypothetical protein